MSANYGVLGHRQQEGRGRTTEVGMRTSRSTQDLVPVPVQGVPTKGVARCLSCKEDLALHQPDVERPDRLLGTCHECGRWYLIDDEAHIMAALPDLRAHRNN